MKQHLTGLSQMYLASLKKYLREASKANLAAALGLGRQAVSLNLETLELARIHEHAFVTLGLSSGDRRLVERAQLFFTEAIIPIVETHPVAQESKMKLVRLNKLLAECTIELAATNRQLERGVVRRKTVEAVLKKNSEDYAKLLRESAHIREGFRQLTHQVLAAQEAERKKISHELQDEIAQTLLGLNVRLVSLKHESRSNNRGLKNEIASARRFVVRSAKSVRAVANRLGNL